MWNQPALRALSESQGNTARTRFFPVLEMGWAEEGKGIFFNFSPVFLHALCGNWMLKLLTLLGPECHLSNFQPPLSVRKRITPTPLKLQTATLWKTHFALNIRGFKQKAAVFALLPPFLFALCTLKAFISTLLHMYWSYFWPRVTWLCLHNWVPTSWSAALIVCKIISWEMSDPQWRACKVQVCLYLKSKI